METKSISYLLRSRNKFAQIAGYLSLSLLVTATITACSDDDNNSSTDGQTELAGYLYTTTNGEGTNQVIKLDRYSDGSTRNEIAYTTNSGGGANTAAGGDARGDFDSLRMQYRSLATIC